MTKIPLLFIDHAPALGGAENSLLLLLAHLDRERWAPHLAGTGGPLLERAAARSIPTHQLPLHQLRHSWRAPFDWMSTARTLADLADSIDATLLYANTVRAACYAAPAALLARRPFVWHMRDFWLTETEPRLKGLDRLLKRVLCVSATVVVANSNATAMHLPGGPNVQVIHNGIDANTFDPNLDGTPFRRTYGIPETAPLVGVVGRLRPWKGQERFLRMAAHIHERRSDVHFAIVGGAPFGDPDGYAQKLTQYARRLGLADRVIFTGHLSDVRPALAALDVMALPGDPEPFGLVNLEAMAMATPVVGFAHGALPEIVVDGKTGILVEPEAERELAEATMALLQDTRQRARLGEAGRQRVRSHFDVQETANRISRLLEIVVS